MQHSSRLDAYKSGSLRARIWKNRTSYILLLPAFAATLLFCYVPMYGLIIAFKDFRPARGIGGSAWADPWFKHFHIMFRDITFLRAVSNTVIISIAKLFIGTFSCILLALLLNEVKNMAFKRTVQTISYLPHFLSWVVLGGVITTLFSGSFGAITLALEKYLGIKYNPLSNPDYYRPLLYYTSMWKGVGFGSIIYLAAISGVSPELYEAATIDGANRFQRVLHITLASIRSTIVLLLILDVGGIMNGNFDQVYNTATQQVMTKGDIIETWVYRRGIEGSEFSYTTAVGLFKQIINIILLLIVNTVAKRFGEEGIF